MKTKIILDITRSPHVVLGVEEAIDLLRCLGDRKGYTRDLSESLRMVENFDEFYGYMRRKFKDYLTPPKDPRDSLLGRIVVHKLKLFEENGRRVEIVFDRRFNLVNIKECLKEIGFEEIEVERQEI